MSFPVEPAPGAPSAPVPTPAPAPLPAPRPLPADAATGLPFHRLVFARQRRGWATPLLVGLLGAAFWAAMLGIVVVALIAIALVVPEAAAGILALGEGVTFDLSDPLLMVLVLGTIALLLPAYLLASLIVNGKRIGLISSVAGRLRWRWMLVCLGIALGVTVAASALSLLLPGEEGELDGVLAPQDNPQLWSMLVLLLLLVPFQAAAEEYVFRGYLQQAVGRWLRHPAFAILLPVPLFVLGHLYDPLGQVAVGLFAVVAGWLTWRTGGLEAAIALHIVNNLFAFLLALAGLSDVNASAPGWESLAFSVLLLAGFAVVVELVYRRGRIGRTLVLTGAVTRE